MPKNKNNSSEKLKPAYELTKKEVTEFQKIGSVGAEKASHALSVLINEEVAVRTVNARSLPVEKIAEVVGGPEDISSTVILRVVGDVAGNILLIFPQKNALALVDLLGRRPIGTSKRLNQLDESALKETGNILSGSFLAALTNYLNVSMVESVPDLATGMARAAVDHVLAEFGQRAEKALAFEVDFELVSESESVSAFFFLLLDLHSAAKVLKTMEKRIAGGGGIRKKFEEIIDVKKLNKPAFALPPIIFTPLESPNVLGRDLEKTAECKSPRFLTGFTPPKTEEVVQEVLDIAIAN